MVVNLPGSDTRNSEQALDRDSGELACFGYGQQLRRSMGAFSSFALSFSLISIITGIFANFTFGFRQAGPAVVWSWATVAVGQFFVALVLADLSARIPLSGYGYQWSTRLVNPHYGFFVGWLLLLQFLAGFPGVCHAMSSAVCSWAFDGSASAIWVPWIAATIVSVVSLIHLFGIRLVAFINDAGVVAEIVATSILTAVLLAIAAWQGDRGVSFLLDRTTPGGAPTGLSGFTLSLLMGAWCLTGFEAAADLAEETHRPTRVIPTVMLTAQVSAAALGLLFLAGLILGIDDVLVTSRHENLVVAILADKLGSRWMPLVMVAVLVSIFACGVASMAATTRLVFSLARDNMLPLSGMLKAVHPRLKTPAGAILLVWFTSTAVILGFRRLEVITSISAGSGFLGFAGIMAASLRARGDSEGFSLGKLQWPIRIVALLWTLIVVAAFPTLISRQIPSRIYRQRARRLPERSASCSTSH